jgi:SNF2 family DNA or RNA helicase
MTAQGLYKFLPRPNAMEIVGQAMQPAIRFTQDQCLDLPPVTFQTRQVPLTPEQKTAYKDMVSKLTMEFQSEQVTAVNQAVKHQKLLQIACGVIYGSDGTEIVLPCQPRIDEILEIIEESTRKVIVFVPFKAVLRYVVEQLEAKGISVARIDGDVSKTQRDRIFHDFQKAATPRVLAAIPDAMAHGLTLTEANTIVWYAPTNKNEIYEQANKRITRAGQTHNQFVIELESTPVERNTYKRLREKGSMQGVLLESLKEKI